MDSFPPDPNWQPSYSNFETPPEPEKPELEAPRKHPWYSWRRLGLNFLTVSILAHLIFGVVAAYFIVQVTMPKKKSFAGGSGGPAAPARAMEHQVQMKKTQAMSAPRNVKRVTSSSALTKVSLPTMQNVKVDAPVVPTTMSGMGGRGLGTGGLGGGGGNGNGNGFGNGSGGPTFFGAHGGEGLVGTFYDLKQNASRQPTGMTPQKYAVELTNFIRGGFNTGILQKYFKGPQPLYATQVFVPVMPAAQGPSAFNLEKLVQPSMWVVHYKGAVSPTKSGRIHFVGGGDDVMDVRFNKKLVLARNWDNPTFGIINTGWRPTAQYNYQASGGLPIPNGFAKGEGIDVTAGETYPMEVLIGEQPGGFGFAFLFIEEEGVEYAKDVAGNPILPVFRLKDIGLPPLGPNMSYMIHADGGPVWRSVKAPSEGGFSVFDH